MIRSLSILLVGISIAGASQLKLAWDASPTAGVNYVLYAHTNSLSATNYSARINVGTNLTATVDSLIPGRWFFAVAARKSGVESDLSTALSVEVPLPPANMRTVILEYTASVTNDFADVGLFRVRIR